MDSGWNERLEDIDFLDNLGSVGIQEIHGEDNRRQVSDTTEFPSSAVAQLIATARDGVAKGGSSGAFIAENVLLTAAHAVFVPGNGPISGMVQSVLVVPGRNGSQTPFGSARTSRFYVPEMWKRHALPDFDYALVFVPPAPRVGRFRPIAASADRLRGLPVRIAGYPLDKPIGTQWFDSRTIAAVSDGQVAYDIDTMRGQSGAAVAHRNNDGAFIVAIHRFGNDRANFGTRITPTILEDIERHISD